MVKHLNHSKFTALFCLSIASLLLMLGQFAQAGLIAAEEAHEAPNFQVSLNESGVGTITLRKCDNCEIHQMQVKPETKFMLNGINTDVQRLAEFVKAPATVFYKPNSQDATRIVIFQRTPEAK